MHLRLTSDTAATVHTLRRRLPFLPSRRHAEDKPLGRGGVDEVRVLVSGGYRPDTIVARVGRPLRIVFRREETAACSERVVFPAFGKSAMLPAYEDVAVELLPEQPGEYEFTCQMGMLRGRLIVTAAGEPQAKVPT